MYKWTVHTDSDGIEHLSRKTSYARTISFSLEEHFALEKFDDEMIIKVFNEEMKYLGKSTVGYAKHNAKQRTISRNGKPCLVVNFLQARHARFM